MSVGNDVVDLAEPETRLEALHPRFEERVFCAAERDLLEASRSRHALHWALWAAKESAYKALKRLAPETVFSPKEFEVDLSPLPPAETGGVAAGWVLRRGRRVELQVHLDGASVHAVARTGEAAGGETLWKVGRALGDPRLAVRRLAVAEVGRALGLDRTVLRIVRRPPLLVYADAPLATEVSLSHHGRFVAFACAMPGRGGMVRTAAAPGRLVRPWPRYERLLPRCSCTVSETTSPRVSK